MSFDLKINHLCPHVQTEEMHVCESDGRRVILNDIMASTGPGSLRVKVNGVEWGRNNTIESPVVFDIGDEIAGLSPTYQMVLPEVPAMRGNQQGQFADSDQHVIIRACARERVPLSQLGERPKTFLVGQNQDAAPLYIIRATAHAWGLVRPKLERAAAPLADQDAILSRYDANPQIAPADLLKNPDILRPELERILSPRSDLDPWSASEILSRFDIDPTSSTSVLLSALTVPVDIASGVEALIGGGREDAVFDTSDAARGDIEVALGAVRTQLERILDADATITPAQKSEILRRYDASPSLGGSELLDGIAVPEPTARRIEALLGDGRQAGTEWVEIPVTPRLPLLGKYDFVEGEIAASDVRAFVNGDQVEVAEVDGFLGVVTLSDAPYPCDLVEFEYCWKMRLLFVSGENGVIAIDPHHLGATSPNAPVITGADVRFFTLIKDGWLLSPNAGSIGGQYDIVFDTTKRTDKGRVILESLGQYANGYNMVFRTSKSPLLPFDAGFFSDPSETLFNSAPLSVNGEIVVPSAFDPVLGLMQLDFPPAPGQDVRVSYYYRMDASDRPLISTAAASVPANPFEPDIVEVDYVTQRTNCHRCNAMGRLDDVHFSPVDGSIASVRTAQKLKQDLYKIVGTVVGSNPFHRFYGTNFTIYIGQSGPPGFFRAQLTNEMISALGALQRLQNDQFLYQAEFIDRKELINAVQSVNVRQVDEIDPGIFQVDVSLLSDAANVVDARVLLTEEGVTLLDRAERRGLKAIPQ